LVIKQGANPSIAAFTVATLHIVLNKKQTLVDEKQTGPFVAICVLPAQVM
jgi:hypothetical protein